MSCQTRIKPQTTTYKPFKQDALVESGSVMALTLKVHPPSYVLTWDVREGKTQSNVTRSGVKVQALTLTVR